jgi:hypothetical protein
LLHRYLAVLAGRLDDPTMPEAEVEAEVEAAEATIAGSVPFRKSAAA